MVLKFIGIVAIAVAIYVIPVSFMAGNPLALGLAVGGLLFGALALGSARVIALLEQMVENTRPPLTAQSSRPALLCG